MVEALTEHADCAAYRVEPGPDRTARETRLEVRRIG